MKTAIPSCRLAVAFALSAVACQPQTRRLLLLDLNLSDPAVLQATAEPWDAAGYTVEYRRGFPHLTRQDLGRYRVVLLLGGREPEAPSDALDHGDLALLTQWVPQGGVLVFGYAGDGEGYQDRWVMNRWLESLGAGLTIGDWALRDDARGRAGMVTPVAGGPLSVSGPDPFPIGRSHVLLIQDPVQTLARASPRAFVDPPGQPPAPRPNAPVIAATRVNRGLVVIASRHALSTLGPEYRAGAGPNDPYLPPDAGATVRARRFLLALARWTRRPAEWARLPTTHGRAPLSLLGAPRPVPPRPPQIAPPTGAGVTRLPEPAPADSAGRARGVPGWIRQQGVRGWSAAPGARIVYVSTLDSLIGFLEAGAFNVLWSSADPTAAESLAAGERRRDQPPRSNLRPLAERLLTTSVLWIPGPESRGGAFIPPADGLERGPGGDTIPTWCTLDDRYWTEVLTPAYVALARLAASRAELVAGVGLDLDPVPRGVRAMAAGFCDATWVAGIRGLQRDSAWTNRLAALPVTARYDALLQGGDLEAYYDVLEREVAERAARIRQAARRFRPDVLFAFRSTALPGDWFTVGLLRGFSTPELPLLLWTREPRAAQSLSRLAAKGGGVNLVHAVGMTTGGIATRDWGGSRLPTLMFEDNGGFWFAADGGAVPPDSVARRIRRLAKQP